MLYWSTPNITYFIISRNKTVFFVIYILFDQKQISTAKYISSAYKSQVKLYLRTVLSYLTRRLHKYIFFKFC
jgi:FtsH-binding integral membrane protein